MRMAFLMGDWTVARELSDRAFAVSSSDARLLLHRIMLEYEEGDFLRSFILSDEVDYDRINATISNGVLKVELPRANKTEPRRIEVNTD